jgi:hypothetical protein
MVLTIHVLFAFISEKDDVQNTKEKMSSTYKERIAEFLTQLKDGAILMERKRNGEKYSRHFFLHDHEHFISYTESDTLFAQPYRCKYNEMLHFFLQRKKIITSCIDKRRVK